MLLPQVCGQLGNDQHSHKVEIYWEGSFEGSYEVSWIFMKFHDYWGIFSSYFMNFDEDSWIFFQLGKDELFWVT